MKKTILAMTILGFVLPSLAAEEQPRLNFGGPLFGGLLGPVTAEEGADFHVGVFTFGLWQNDASTISSKFLEYRDIPQGAQSPFFRLQGKRGSFRYDVAGHDVTQDDQRYTGRFEAPRFKLDVDYTGIPHRFGNGGKSILEPVSETEWRLSDTLQEAQQEAVEALAPTARTYPNLAAIAAPTLDAKPPNLDIQLQRNRTHVAFSLLPAEAKNFDVGFTYFHERRSGTRTNNGTSFGFSNVVETPEPVRFITQDFGINATTNGSWGVASAALHFNDFSDRFPTFAWDNPWRAFDATDPNAYTAPGSGSINGSSTGLAALPPSNEAWNVSGGTTLKLGPRTRLTADLQFGQWQQNESFIPFTTNTAILTPSGERAIDAPLPASSLNGQIDVFAVNGFLTTRLTNDLRLNARYRLYENDNRTPRLRFEEGYVRFDAVWEEIPRVTVPYGFDSNYLDLYGNWDVGRILGFEVGYKWNRIGRTFRETERTSENTVRAAADLKLDPGLLVRAIYEFGSREYDEYDSIHGEEASFLDPDAPALITTLRRYDQANRDRNRVGAQLQWSPESAIFTLSAGYFLNRDDYDDSAVPCVAATPSDLAFCPGGEQTSLGLREARYETFNLDADFSPSDRYSLYAFYSREDIFQFQTGRQSGATINFNPTSNWSSRVDDKVDTVGAGANFTLVPAKWFFDLFYRFQRVDGFNDFEAGPALRPASNPVQDIAAYDDTRIHFTSAQVRRRFAQDWTVAVGGFWEEYGLDDVQTGQVLFYMPGSFFINANNGDYQAWVGWVNLSYSF